MILSERLALADQEAINVDFETSIATEEIRSETDDSVATVTSEEFQNFGKECMSHYADLYRFALRISRNPDTAKELVSITMFKALRSFKSFKETGALRPWLFKILRNTFISEIKSKRNTDTVQLTDIAVSTTPSHTPVSKNEILEEILNQLNISGQPCDLEELDRVLDANLDRIVSKPVAESLRSLSPKYRVLLLLRENFDLSYDELSDVLDIPAGSVMSGLSRAKEKLRANENIQAVANADYGIAAA